MPGLSPRIFIAVLGAIVFGGLVGTAYGHGFSPLSLVQSAFNTTPTPVAARGEPPPARPQTVAKPPPTKPKSKPKLATPAITVPKPPPLVTPPVPAPLPPPKLQLGVEDDAAFLNISQPFGKLAMGL